MKKLVLNAENRSYNIFCGQGILSQIDTIFDLNAEKICIITDTNVAPLYLESLKNAIKKDIFQFIYTAGEASKTLETCSAVYNYLAKNGFTKSDLIIALGGGVCGDLTGFIAATYLRGIKYYSIPTTLLAQVDSSVGGKCGVDISYGKNLVGAIYQPYGVMIDTDFLKTLSKSDFADGMAEVIKYGFIYDRSIYDKCLENLQENLFDIIFRCVDIKREIVEADEFDNGLRMILNFGHTIGHAIEQLGNFSRYTHGQAVAIGMAYASKLSEISGIGCKGLYKEVTDVLNFLGLPVKTDYKTEDILPVLLNDKKVRNGRLNFILLKEIGSSLIYKIDSQNAGEFIEQVII